MSTSERRPPEEIDVAFNDKLLFRLLVLVKIIQNLFEAIVIITYIYLASSLWKKKVRNLEFARLSIRFL